MQWSCHLWMFYVPFISFFGTNLLIQFQVSVPVFSVFLTFFRSDFGTESKRNKIPEINFSRTEEYRGTWGPRKEAHREPTSPVAVAREGPRQPSLWPPCRCPALALWPINSLKIQKNQGIHENTFPPPQASVSARSHLETLPGTLPEGTLEVEGFFIISIAPPMTRE